jgi:hypothetical protein
MSAFIECVCVHAWRNTAEGVEHCDPSEATPDGWSVYERTVPDAGGLFDIDYEADFATRDEALQAAEIRAAIHNVIIDEY